MTAVTLPVRSQTPATERGGVSAPLDAVQARTAASARGLAHRRKGAAAELAVARYLRDEGFPEAKRNVDRRQDAGDLIGVGRAGLEVKNCRKHDLSGWLAQARTGCEEAGKRYPVVVVKPVGVVDPGRWYAVTDMATLIALLREAMAPTAPLEDQP